MYFSVWTNYSNAKKKKKIIIKNTNVKDLESLTQKKSATEDK